MHILHILDHSVPVQDDYSHRTLALLRGQRALGWNTSHLTSAKQGEGSSIAEEVEGFEFYRTPDETGFMASAPVLEQFSIISGLRRRLDDLIPRLKPDILHAHSPALDGLAALQAGRKFGLPVVYEVRGFWEDLAVEQDAGAEWGPRYRATRALETWVLRRADRVTTVCEALRSDMAARGIASSKMTVVPNGVDPNKMRARAKPEAELLQKFGLDHSTVLGFVGSFHAYEGLQLLVTAMPRLLEQRRDLRLLLVGGGDALERINAQVAELGLEGRVICTGPVADAEVERYYDLMDLLIYPRVSLRITELVTPIKPLEAMLRGQIVLCSDVGGHRELVTPGETGYLFPPGDPGAVTSAVLDVLARRDEWSGVQAAARRYVLEQRSWERAVSCYPAVYEGLAP